MSLIQTLYILIINIRHNRQRNRCTLIIDIHKTHSLTLLSPNLFNTHNLTKTTGTAYLYLTNRWNTYMILLFNSLNWIKLKIKTQNFLFLRSQNHHIIRMILNNRCIITTKQIQTIGRISILNNPT